MTPSLPKQIIVTLDTQGQISVDITDLTDWEAARILQAAWRRMDDDLDERIVQVVKGREDG